MINRDNENTWCLLETSIVYSSSSSWQSHCASNSNHKAGIAKEHHVYKVIWTFEVGEQLVVNCEYGNEHKEHAIAVGKDSENVGLLFLFVTIADAAIYLCYYCHADVVPCPQH